MKRKQKSRMVGTYSDWKAPKGKQLSEFHELLNWGNGKDGMDATSKPRRQQLNERQRLG